MFSRHDYVVSSEFDGFFRVAAGRDEFIEMTTGHVDVLGHLTMLDVDMSNYESALSIGEPVPSQGFYLVHTSSMGIIVAFAYETAGERREDFEEFEHASSEMEALDEEEDVVE